MEQGPSGSDDRRKNTPLEDDDRDGVIGEIAPDEVGADEAPDEPSRPRTRHRSRTIGCLLAILGALAGAGVALWLSRGAVIDAPPADPPELSGQAREAGLPANRLLFSPTPRRPEATPDIITAETELIYCFYDIGRLPADAPLSATWSHEGEPLGELPLHSHARDALADHARGRFAIRAPSATGADDNDSGRSGFSSGIYEVQLTSPDYPDINAVASFVALPRAARILEGGGEPEGPPVIRSLRTASGITDAGEPIEPSAAFSPDVNRIVAVFTYRGVVPGSVLTVRWHAGEQELRRARSEIAVTAAEGRAEAWLEVGEGDRLPAGEYRVSVLLGEDPDPLATTGFEIEEPSPTSTEPGTS